MIKKLTAISLILFGLVVVSIFVMSIAYPTVDTTVAGNETVASSNVTSSNESLTMTNIAQHDQKDDCYLVIDSKIYDVSSYIGKHPGGTRSITSRCGEEVTGIFASIHSNFAWDLLNDYYIGAVASESAVASSTSAVAQLQSIEDILNQHYSGAEIVSVKPKSDFYVAKMFYNNALYEVHIDMDGNILSEEVENDEFDWGTWDTDSDDM